MAKRASQSSSTSPAAATSRGASSGPGLELKPGELRVQLDDDDVALLDATSTVSEDDEEGGSRSSPVGNAVRAGTSKKTVGGMLVTVLLVSSIGAEVYESVNLHKVKEGTNKATSLERILMKDQETLKELKLSEEQLKSNMLRYVEGSGILSFENYGSQKFTYTAVSMATEKSWSKSRELCQLVGASLAEPSSFDEFQAIALASRKKGRCFIGPIRNSDGLYWTRADGESIDLTLYWGKNEPTTSPSYSCAIVLSESDGTFLHNAQCDGNVPSIECFICQKSL